MLSSTPLFIRSFRLSHVLDRQTLAVKRKMSKYGWNVFLHRRNDILANRKKIVEYYEKKQRREKVTTLQVSAS
jgi:hypothetical protein